MILLATEGRLLTRDDRLFNVAVTSRASLFAVSEEPMSRELDWTNLLLSCNTPSSLSSKPEASASRVEGDTMGWSRGTRASEISFCSGR